MPDVDASLLLQITTCSEVAAARTSPGHPCSKIVASQGQGAFQVPEPWTGTLDSSPLLFLSSNPSIGPDVYPDEHWTDAEVSDFFTNRFQGGDPPWSDGATRLRFASGSDYYRVPFYEWVAKHARSMLDRPVVAGRDYTLTEVVHCKSQSEVGVPEALLHCADKWLMPILEASPARVVVVLGARARDTVRRRFRIETPPLVWGPARLGERERMLVFLPHPNAYGERTVEGRLDPSEVLRLRSYLAGAPVPALQEQVVPSRRPEQTGPGVGSTADQGLGPLQRSRQRFWQQLLEEFDARYPGDRTSVSRRAPFGNTVTLTTGSPRRTQRQFDLSNDGPRHQLLIMPKSGDPAAKLRAVARLRHMEPVLREQFVPTGREKLQVEALPGGNQCRLAAYMGMPKGTENRDPRAVREWLLDSWPRLQMLVETLNAEYGQSDVSE